MKDFIPFFHNMVTTLEEGSEETASKSEPAQRMGAFVSMLREKFGGQRPTTTEVNTAIQPREAPNLEKLPTIDEITNLIGKAENWEPNDLGGDGNFWASTESPELPAWQEYWLAADLHPGAETGKTWGEVNIHKRPKTPGSDADPYLQLKFYGAQEPREGQVAASARLEIVFFTQQTGGKETASVTQKYTAKS